MKVRGENDIFNKKDRSKKISRLSGVWRCTPVIPVEMLQQEDSHVPSHTGLK